MRDSWEDKRNKIWKNLKNRLTIEEAQILAEMIDCFLVPTPEQLINFWDDMGVIKKNEKRNN